MAELKHLIKEYRVWLVIIVLIATFLLVYYPHFSYPYPLHADEWNSINSAEKLLNGEYGVPYAEFGKNFEFGYHASLAFIFLIEKVAGISPILAYKFLPAIFAVFASLFLFLLMFKLTGNYFISLFSMVFFASLPSNVNLLGLWFAVPLTLAIPLVYLFFYFFLQEGKRTLVYSIIILFAIFFIHAPSALILLPVLFFYSVFNYRKILKKQLLVFLPYVIFFFIGFVSMWYKTIWKTLSIMLNAIVFKAGDSHIELNLETNPLVYNFFGEKIILSQYFLPLLYGFVPFILVLIGLYYALKNERLRIFAIWLFVCVINLFIFNLLDFTIFARSQRVVYYTLLALAPLSAIGMERIVSYIKEKIRKENMKKIIAIIAILLVLAASFYNYGKQNKGTEIYYLINEKDFKALTFLKDKENGILIAPLKEAVADYSIAGKKAVAKFYPPYEMNENKMDVERFYASGCEIKEMIIRKYNATYVLSKEKLACEWKEIYSDERFIYEV